MAKQKQQESLEELIKASEMRYIAIEGVIGAGKTTLAKMVGEMLQAKVVLEQFQENPFLKDFYKDPNVLSSCGRECAQHVSLLPATPQV